MTEEANVAAESAQLSLQDISTCVQIIDICSRGGFEGQELETVGALRNRIVKFLEENAKQSGQDVPEGSVPEVVESEDSDDS